MSTSTASRLESQNNSERPSSSRTSTVACSELPQHFCIVPCIPANWLFQCPSLTRTTVPLRASYRSTAFTTSAYSKVGARESSCDPNQPSFPDLKANRCERKLHWYIWPRDRETYPVIEISSR